jgi:hypothetical protein
MSTISTHLNWGASYVVDDVYRRFVAGDRDEHHYVRVARLTTVVLILLSSLVALWLENAFQAFQILLQIGAGTGLVFLLRWYWWRINSLSEIAAMVVSCLAAVYFTFVHAALGFAPMAATTQLVVGVGITTAGWMTVTLLTPATDRTTLQSFYDLIHPLGSGWDGAVETRPHDGTESLTAAFLSWFLGCLAIYGALFGTGYALYGRAGLATLCFGACAIAVIGLFRTLPRVGLSR